MDAVEEVKARINIEDVISEYVQLKRAGRNFKGLSPFGNEKTPSFMVSPEKQIWHDFSSGKGGNVFSFVMEMEGLDFKGALELLARKAGVDLDQYRNVPSGGSTKQKERLYDALEQATKFYQTHFSRNPEVLAYVLKKRGFTKATALEFRIGYSPNNGSALFDYLVKRGFSEAELSAAGLITKRYRGIGDMFRGRLMVPLMDGQGRVVGFTARQLDDDPNAPKYINTPQTRLYDKSRHVFGLHLAKESIRREGYAVLVEGNLDVIASHQAGVRQTVATAGTALTEMQLKAISRLAPEVRLAFDQDRAGQSATERAIPIASKVGIRLSMISIQEGKDPDELIKKDPALWQATITKPQVALEWLIERYAEQLDLQSAPGKREFSDVLTAVIRQLPDPVEQDHYIQRVAQILHVSDDAMRAKLKPQQTPQHRLKQPGARYETPSAEILEVTKLQNHLLCLALMRPELRKYLEELTPEMLAHDDARKLLEQLRIVPRVQHTVEVDVQNAGDYGKMLQLQYETLYQDLEDVELPYEALRIQARLIERYVKQRKAGLIAAMRNADEQQTNELLQQAKELDQQLKRIKEAL